eukprot:jgi/Bigna1/89500/estExt_fgenesh1_pg.C_500074
MGAACSAGSKRSCSSSNPSSSQKSVETVVQELEAKYPSEPLKIIHQMSVHKDFWEVRERLVKHPKGNQIKYQLCGHPPTYAYVVVFPFHHASQTVTIIREWQQGLNQWWWQLPTGGWDRSKAKDLNECACNELAEEAMLVKGRMIPLLDDRKTGIAEISFSQNSWYPFLSLDSRKVDPKDKNKRQRDLEEEGLIHVHEVSLAVLFFLIKSGKMIPTSAMCSMMAMAELRKRSLLT